jgi:TatA/E family protein of Tat protein translocase
MIHMPLAFLSNMSMSEWLIVLAAALLLFGAKRLPELAKSLGKSVNEFKRGLADTQNTIEKSPDDASKSSSDQNKPDHS